MSFRTSFPVSFLASFLRNFPTSFQRRFRLPIAGPGRDPSIGVGVTRRVIFAICVICGYSAPSLGGLGARPLLSVGVTFLGVCRRTHFDRTRSRRFWSGKSWPASFTVRRLPIADSEVVLQWVPSGSSSG